MTEQSIPSRLFAPIGMKAGRFPLGFGTAPTRLKPAFRRAFFLTVNERIDYHIGLDTLNNGMVAQLFGNSLQPLY